MDHRQQRPRRRTLQWQLTQEPGPQSPPCRPSAASAQPDPESNSQEDLQSQDWVCEPPEHGRPGSRWNVSIHERRRLAMLHARERPEAVEAPPQALVCCGPGPRACPPPQCCSPLQDIVQMVAELVSKDVDRDVLVPHPLSNSDSSNAFLARSASFWQSGNFEAGPSRSPPS